MAKTNITLSSSSAELASPGAVSPERVRERWGDWQVRVSRLYADIERALRNTPFGVRRTSGKMSDEELPKRVGVKLGEPPNVLHIMRPDGSDAAILTPRGLWIIGANGRVDLKITPPVGGSEVYMLIDESYPLSGSAHWVSMPIGAPFNREPFRAATLTAKLQ